MNSRYWVPVLAMVVALLASGSALLADSRPEIVSLGQLPPAVKVTLLKESDGGVLDDIKKYSDDDEVTYMTAANINGKFYNLSIDKDGTLCSKDWDKERIPLEKVPAAAMAALTKAGGGAKVTAVNQGTDDASDDGKIVYTATVMIKDAPFEVTVDGDGTIVSKDREDTGTGNDDDAEGSEEGSEGGNGNEEE